MAALTNLNLADALGAKPAQKPAVSNPTDPAAPTKPRSAEGPPQQAQATESNSPVPIVDFSAFSTECGGVRGGDADADADAARRCVARELDDALRTVGFVYLRNHGLSKDEVERVFEWSTHFFALPQSTKLLAPHPPGGQHHRGYSAPGLEKVTQHTYTPSDIASLRTAAPDVKESFECGNESDAAQPNIWLPETALPGFREAMMRFFAHAERLTHAVLCALGLALDLADADMLSRAHASSAFQLRLLHYPRVAARLLREQAAARIDAHSDFGSITLLFQDAVGGLEIETESEKGGRGFRAVPPVEGAVLVNVGDLLERWSNGRWRSTVHRVGVPASLSTQGEGEGEREDMCEARYSIPFFAAPDPETVIEALPGCWGEDNPKRYPPVTAVEYVTMRMNALY